MDTVLQHTSLFLIMRYFAFHVALLKCIPFYERFPKQVIQANPQMTFPHTLFICQFILSANTLRCGDSSRDRVFLLIFSAKMHR